jgi:hypothetical protein
MGRDYSIGAAAILAAATALAAVPCPPDLSAVAREIAVVRQVPPPFAPPCRMIAADQLRQELDRKLRRDLPLAPEVFIEALQRTGMVDGKAPELYRRLLDFYGSQVLGFYEPEGDDMVLVEGNQASGVTARLVWAHEVAHAAQEHRFHLPSRLLGIRDDGDAQRAASAIAEGEAMLVMTVIEYRDSGAELDVAGAAAAMAAQARAFTPPPGVPDYFAQDLLFPYTAGFATVSAAYGKGGWPAVDALLARPPTTTAALLYPDRPRTGPPLADSDLPATPAQWSTVLTDTLGAWGTRFWLSRSLPEAEADALASGWDGDRLRLVRSASAPDCWALAWRIRCRDEAARRALETALQRALPARLARLCPAAGLDLTWIADGRSFEVRAGWPHLADRPAVPTR